jgi:hypothetical protein
MQILIRNWLELLYFISGAITAIVALYGLKQLQLLKTDIRTRNERAAKEKAIEFSIRYADAFVPLSKTWLNEQTQADVPLWYSGPVTDFTWESLPKQFRAAAQKKFSLHAWMAVLNELMVISAAFVTGVADEEVGFAIFGRSFCANVSFEYDLLSFIRKNEAVHGHYETIVQLYQLWAPRLSKSELEQEKQAIETKIAGMKSNSIKPIGL